MFVIDQAKEQLNEIIEEFAVCIALLSIYSFTLLFQLIYPKELFYKGSPPEEIFYQEIFKDRAAEEGYKNVLYNEIERMQ
jgi:hypothetical protein